MVEKNRGRKKRKIDVSNIDVSKLPDIEDTKDEKSASLVSLMNRSEFEDRAEQEMDPNGNELIECGSYENYYF